MEALGSALVSKTIAEFVTRISSIGNVQNRLSKLEDYIGRLEEEMRTVHELKPDLRLCMFLLSDAIVYLKEQSRRWCTDRGSDEVEKPVLKEIDLLCTNEIEGVRENNTGCDNSVNNKSWTSSLDLLNCDLNLGNDSTKLVKQKVEEPIKQKKGELFMTTDTSKECEVDMLKVSSTVPGMDVAWNEEKKLLMPVPDELSLVPSVVSTLLRKSGSTDLNSSISGGVALSGSPQGHLNLRNGMLMPYHQQQSSRKQRRCWSPELHKTFVSALQQLGGPQVATPKQIRDLMRVNGLTNDEVKSHLQKYRLHIKRVPNKHSVLGSSWNDHNQCGQSSNHEKGSESGSPPGPLELCVNENFRSYD